MLILADKGGRGGGSGFLYMSVYALKTLYFSFLCVTLLLFLFAKLCLANSKVTFWRLIFNGSRFNVVKASKYDLVYHYLCQDICFRQIYSNI